MYAFTFNNYEDKLQILFADLKFQVFFNWHRCDSQKMPGSQCVFVGKAQYQKC